MGRGRSPAPLLLILAAFSAALPYLAESSGRHDHHHHSQHPHLQIRGNGGGDEKQVSPTKEPRRQWPCCDDCGGCTKSIPAQCRCMDAAPGGCHPACRDCVRSALSVDPPVYQCMDRVPNFCQRRCNAAVAAH